MNVILSWYTVKNLERAKKFYGEVLGLKKTFEMQGWAEFSHAEGAAGIGLAENPQANGSSVIGGATVVLGVQDLDRVQEELSARGVKFEEKIEEIPGVVRIATFQDPFGNRLQLAQSLLRR